MKIRPDNVKENAIIIGVDEAGRGPLAGPVMAAAVYLPENFPVEIASQIADSKKLSEKKRDTLAVQIYEHAHVGVVSVSAKEIDHINIRQATLKAMTKAVKSLSVEGDMVLVDGRDILQDIPQSMAVIKGDDIYIPIAAASIIAKTMRDDFMKKIDENYPEYGFKKHKGYPTKAHMEALMLHGVTPIHRKSYKPVQAVITRTEVIIGNLCAKQ